MILVDLTWPWRKDTMHRYHDGKPRGYRSAFGSTTRLASIFWALLALACSLCGYAQESRASQRPAPMLPPVGETVWIEAETMGPLRGANFSFQQEAQQTRGSWSLSGPGVAAERNAGHSHCFSSRRGAWLGSGALHARCLRSRSSMEPGSSHGRAA